MFLSSVEQQLDNFRCIKRQILNTAFSSENKNANRILITSVDDLDGKSFVAANLAYAISLEQNKTALLVDVNMHNPNKTFDIIPLTLDTPQSKIGLLDYLKDEDKTPLSSFLQTIDKHFVYLPFGTYDGLNNEYLSSDKMKQLNLDFNTRYNDRLVLLDAPSLKHHDATLLANMVDQIIVVINEGKTSVRDLKRAHKVLPQNIPIHYVINRVNNATKKHFEKPVFTQNDKALTGSSALA